MRLILLILFIAFIIPDSFADESKTLVASINTKPGAAGNISVQNKPDRASYSEKFNLQNIDINLVYENTYDFVKSHYSRYSEMNLLNSDIAGIEKLKDSVTFIGGVVPFVSLAENDGRDGGTVSGDGMSIFFFYKRQF